LSGLELTCASGNSAKLILFGVDRPELDADALGGSPLSMFSRGGTVSVSPTIAEEEEGKVVVVVEEGVVGLEPFIALCRGGEGGRADEW
jgi:hypothetical protein